MRPRRPQPQGFLVLLLDNAVILHAQPANERFCRAAACPPPSLSNCLCRNHEFPLSYHDLQAVPSIAWHRSSYMPCHAPRSQQVTECLKCHSLLTVPKGKLSIAVFISAFSHALTLHLNTMAFSSSASFQQNMCLRCYTTLLTAVVLSFLSLHNGFFSSKLKVIFCAL